jgi:hypothetical protein
LVFGIRFAAPKVLIGSFLLLNAGCSASTQASGAIMAATPVTPGVHLVLENRGFSDLRIYAILNDAAKFPLGTVGALSTLHRALPASLIAARNFQLVAVPLALGEETSIDVLIFEGETLIWYLENDAAFSHLVKR